MRRLLMVCVTAHLNFKINPFFKIPKKLKQLKYQNSRIAAGLNFPFERQKFIYQFYDTPYRD